MLNQDKIVKVRGELVRVLHVDPDPRADVWGVAISDPDRSVWFQRDEATNA